MNFAQERHSEQKEGIDYQMILTYIRMCFSQFRPELRCQCVLIGIFVEIIFNTSAKDLSAQSCLQHSENGSALSIGDGVKNG